MRSTSIVSVLYLAAATALAAPSGKRTVQAVKESHLPPAAWKKLDVVVPDHVLRLTIGLKSAGFDRLEEHLSKSSDPSHHMYGAHLSADEVNDLMAPSTDALDAVHGWLASHDIHGHELDYSPAGDWVMVNVPLSKVEQMLDTKYHIFEHGRDGDRLVRAPTWSLPEYLHEHIEVVQPTNSFFRPTRHASGVRLADTFPIDTQFTPSSQAAGVPSVCNETAVTPACLRTLYGTIDYKAQAADKNGMGLNNFLAEVNNRSDTALFLKRFRPEAAGAAYTFQTQVINGGNNYQGQENSSRLASGSDIEGDLDSETMLGIAWPTKLTTFNTGGSPPFKPDLFEPTDSNEPYLTWLNAVLGQHDLPYVVSTSYADDEQTVPPSYARKVCAGFAQLGARGVSLFFGSGDAGVGQDGDCVTNDGRNTSTFLASFPSTCPYITSVGGTRNFNPEIVAFDTANGYVAGGGFSRYFNRPHYQDGVVPAYIKSLGNNFKGLYNPNGRGYPDVAASSYRFVIAWNGSFIGVDGTSAATPTFSSVIVLVNDALLAAGRPTLGFLNPFLYARGYQALTDVTQGSVSGCNTAGFPAAKGWDAASGFGTPNFKKLVDLAKQCGSQYAFTSANVTDDGLNA